MGTDMAEPLKIDQDNWRSRWLVFSGSGRVLHRVAVIEWEDDEDMIAGDGVVLCGRKGWLHMPGIFSRMDLKRCPKCCRLMGIPQGDGAPFNANILEPGDEPWAPEKNAAALEHASKVIAEKARK
jgi:hypothetical protein